MEQQASTGGLDQKVGILMRSNQSMEAQVKELQQAIDKTVELADGALKRNEAHIQEVQLREETMGKRMDQLQRELHHEFGSLRTKTATTPIVEAPPGMKAAAGPEWATLSAYVNRTELDGMSQRIDNAVSQTNSLESSVDAKAQHLASQVEELLIQMTVLAAEVNTRPCHCIHLDALDKHVRGEITEKVDKVIDELKKTHTNMGEQCNASQAKPSFLV